MTTLEIVGTVLACLFGLFMFVLVAGVIAMALRLIGWFLAAVWWLIRPTIYIASVILIIIMLLGAL